jgi:hypothetical protein
MLSLFKVALFSLISFATLALAMPASEPRTLNAKDLLNDVKDQIGNALAPSVRLLAVCSPSHRFKLMVFA